MGGNAENWTDGSVRSQTSFFCIGKQILLEQSEAATELARLCVPDGQTACSLYPLSIETGKDRVCQSKVEVPSSQADKVRASTRDDTLCVLISCTSFKLARPGFMRTIFLPSEYMKDGTLST
jgi:hypothetical protein